jgi:ribulose kinase
LGAAAFAAVAAKIHPSLTLALREMVREGKSYFPAQRDPT